MGITFDFRCIDLYLAATGNKLRLKKILDTKIYPFAEVLKFFCMKEWQIKDDNIKIMWEDLTQSDKEKYSFDSSTLTLNDIVNIKEKMEENYRALRKQTILYFVDQFLVALLVIGFSWIFYKICGFLL
ncbi:Male sterility protein [Popillia japonica]|uniref:Male sterility protein n=1 Tax=Popillia japonica TaxID=7064 RepID=A0AAW1LTD3_POPJA